VVEYEPGGHTPVHLHSNMEQMEVVLSGRALWEVGEMEREVGPGDIIFCPRNVKHGYKVLGNQPFRFFQIEWREWKQDK
jgi:quercetin dioxygenase-like cupin family protein